jgi:hypothetical protein
MIDDPWIIGDPEPGARDGKYHKAAVFGGFQTEVQ